MQYDIAFSPSQSLYPFRNLQDIPSVSKTCQKLIACESNITDKP